MKSIREAVRKKHGHYPERILQFGEGNFLRAFADWMIEEANEAGVYEGSVVLCQPIAQGLAALLQEQDCIYTVLMRGIEDGRPQEKSAVITSVSRCVNPYRNYEELLKLAESPDLQVIVSNTTEAGIVWMDGEKADDAPPASFPAKLCAFLYRRFAHFGGRDAPLLILPAELIDDNGSRLKDLVLRHAREWNLETAFIEWLNSNAFFTNTLVDRIVTGFPKDALPSFEEKSGYRDNLLVACELFNLWVIEGKKEWADILPLHKTCANVVWTGDVAPYKKRKVRILNGSHTAAAPGAYLAGFETVAEMLGSDVFREYESRLIFDEIVPSINLPQDELTAFARQVQERFGNPFIVHRLWDITLNDCSKYSARCLPSLLEYLDKTGHLPPLLTFSLAVFFRFYRVRKKGDGFCGRRENGEEYAIKDDKDTLEFFAGIWRKGNAETAIHRALSHAEFWNGRNLAEIPHIEKTVAEHFISIEQKGIEAAIKSLLA
jgi:tagaturonate reductase